MSYVRSVLQPNETVRTTTSIHWIIYWRGIVALLAAVMVLGISLEPVLGYLLGGSLALILLAVAVWFLFQAWFRRWTTEIAVTNRRIIRKEGFIWRKTTEIALDKVESVDVVQSIAGRLLDYGDVRVHGTGQAIETMRMISAPIAFRNRVTAD